MDIEDIAWFNGRDRVLFVLLNTDEGYVCRVGSAHKNESEEEASENIAMLGARVTDKQIIMSVFSYVLRHEIA